MAAKKQWYTEDDISIKIYSLKFCDIWQNFYLCILNNENFKMEIEQMNFVTHLINTVQLYITSDYLKNRLLEIGQISFKW